MKKTKDKISTLAERRQCKELYDGGMTVDDIANSMKKLKRSVIDTLRREGERVSIVYTREHDDFLKEHYQYAPWEYLEDKLPFTHQQIVRRANILGLYREGSYTGKGFNSGMTNREEYGLTLKEWQVPPRQVPAGTYRGTKIHPKLIELF